MLRAVLPPSARQLRRREQALELAPISLELAPISLKLAPILTKLAPISLEVRAELQSRQARCLRRPEAAEQRRLDETSKPVPKRAEAAALCMRGHGPMHQKAASLCTRSCNPTHNVATLRSMYHAVAPQPALGW